MKTRNNSLEVWVQARAMALMGYVTKIIILETGLTDKQLRRLYRELEEEGMQINRNRHTRAVRGGATLLTNQLTKFHASLLMTLYRNIGSCSVDSSINISALDRAYRMYQALISEMAQTDASIRRDTYTVSDAWCLASELRSGDAMLERCRGCDCEFFTSIHQTTGINCPFCYQPQNLSRGEKVTEKAEIYAERT